MRTRVIIRKAEKKDNSELLHLGRQAVQEGVLSYYSDQSPDFFSLLDAISESYTLWVAEEENRICGCIGEFASKVLFNGEKAQGVYIGELKVLPEARGMLAFSLGFHVGRRSNQSGYDVGFGFILDGNQRSKKLSEFIVKKYVPNPRISWVNSYQLLPIKKYRVDPAYHVRTATKKDIASIARLLKTQYASYHFSPLFSETWLEREISRQPAFSIQNFRIAEVKGKTVACAAFWDQSGMRKTIISKFSFTIKTVFFLLNILRPIYHIPQIPGPGEALNYRYLRFPAAIKSHKNALKAIVHREINTLGRDRSFHFLWGSFHENDPLNDLVRDMKKIKTRTHMYTAVLSDHVAQIPSRDPVYVDFSLI